MRLLLFLLAAATPAFADLLITEIVTDPQADHSENTGGNGTPFDTIPGTGTVSSVDEFVEVHNGGTTTVDLRDYVLELVDTTPSDFRFGADSGLLRFTAGSSVDALLPGGFVVLGNPPGVVNNMVTARLLDPDGDVVDLLAIENGNAATAADEAITRVFDGTTFLSGTRRAAITPLAAPPRTVPEPALAALLLLSAVCGRATRRRGARGRRRTRC